MNEEDLKLSIERELTKLTDGGFARIAAFNLYELAIEFATSHGYERVFSSGAEVICSPFSFTISKPT